MYHELHKRQLSYCCMYGSAGVLVHATGVFTTIVVEKETETMSIAALACGVGHPKQPGAACVEGYDTFSAGTYAAGSCATRAQHGCTCPASRSQQYQV